jgi:hypothetical protein
MSLKDILSEKKDSILEKWFHLVLESYPAETAKFLKNQKNRFANPVGQTIHEGLQGIFEELLADGEKEKVSVFLDNIIRIRAVQDFTPSQAVSFIFLLKGVIREEMRETPPGCAVAEDLSAFESRIDSFGLLAFDIFMQCREKLYDIKAKELRNMTYRLLKSANLITELEEREKALDEGNLINIQRKEVNT